MLAGADAEIDARVCDCCQTDAVNAGNTAVLVYRDRSDDETRDIYATRLDSQGRGSNAIFVTDPDGTRIELVEGDFDPAAYRARG